MIVDWSGNQLSDIVCRHCHWNIEDGKKKKTFYFIILMTYYLLFFSFVYVFLLNYSLCISFIFFISFFISFFNSGAENCEENPQIQGLQLDNNKWTFNTESTLIADKLSGSYITCSLIVPSNGTVVAILYQPSQTHLDDDFGDMPCMFK